MTDKTINEINESEKRFKELADSLPQIVFEMDTSGRLTFVNSCAYSTFGYTEMELGLGVQVLDMIIPEDRLRAKANIERVFRGEKFVEEYTAVKKDGTRFPVMIHSSCIKNKDRITGIRGIIIDFTERKHFEQTIIESEERYRALVENQAEGVISIDTENKVIYNNSSAERIFGTGPGKLIGHCCSELFGKDVCEQIKNSNNGQKNSERKVFEVEISRPDKEKRTLHLRVSSYIKSSGSILGYFAIFEDITEQKRTGEKLRKLSRAVDQSANAICITDTRGNIEYVNPRFCAVSGYTSDEIIGKNPRILKSGETPDSEYRTLWTTITAGHEWRGEFHNKRKNGELFWESVSISPIFNEDNEITHFLAVKENITAKKEAEIEIIKAKEEAEKSSRLKTEFLAQMSHEIRTPLNSILSFTSLLREELEGKIEDDLKSSFKIIENGGRRLIRTIDLILSMSQLQTGNHDVYPARLSLSRDIIENVILDFMNPAREKKLKLEFCINTEDDTIFADNHTVTQIFMNLLDNAVKYTSAGRIEIEIGEGDAADEIFAEVRDTGIGISEDYMPQLFEAFTQEDTGYTRKFEGNGLGLALVKKYAELNNASIIVKSKKGEGSSFRVVFKREK